MMNDVDRTELKLLALADALLISSDLLASPRLNRMADRAVDRATLERLSELLAPESSIALVETLSHCFELATATPLTELVIEYTRLFEGPVACPINETGYVRRDKGVILADICGFYRAFGFEPDEACGEKADHLRTELEFTSLMLIMLVNAVREDNSNATDVTRDALRTFLNEHLGEWIRPFHDRLIASAALPLYAHAAELMRAVWNAMAPCLEVPAFETLGEIEPLPEPDDTETPYECGMAEDEAEQFVSLTGPAGSGLPTAD
jgi:TorA maturation chaperone TorD